MAGRDEDEPEHVCLDCKKPAPWTNTARTLIHTHGWRLSPRTTPDGRIVEWRCRECWRIFKAARLRQ